MTDIDLTFWSYRETGSTWLTVPTAPDVWMWQPGQFPTYAHQDPAVRTLAREGWVDTGRLVDATVALWIFHSQLTDIRLVANMHEGAEGIHIWMHQADKKRGDALPVLLAFTASPEQQQRAAPMPSENNKKLEVKRTLPPPRLGELALIASKQNGQPVWLCCTIDKLEKRSQELQKRLGAALEQLEPRLEPRRKMESSDWLRQWGEIQKMARRLATDYFNVVNQGPRPYVPNMFVEGAAWAFADSILYKITTGLRNGAEGASKWNHSETEDSYFREGNVTLRLLPQQPGDTSILVENELIKKALAERPRALKPQDTTNLIALLIHWMKTPKELRDEEGYLWTDTSTILDLRGLEPIMRTENGKERRAGHQQANKQAFADSIERLAWAWVDIDVRITGPKSAKARKGRLIEIKNRWDSLRIQDDGTLSEEPYKWLWRPGEPLRHITSKAIYLQQVLRYNHQKEKWPLYLAMVFTFLLSFHAKDSKTISAGTVLGIRVSALLDRCSLLENREYLLRRPEERLLRPFETAMNRLEADGFISSWDYREGRDTLDMTKAHWADRWLGFTVQVQIGHVLLDPPGGIKGYRKIIESKKQHQGGAPKSPRISRTAQRH